MKITVEVEEGSHAWAVAMREQGRRVQMKLNQSEWLDMEAVIGGFLTAVAVCILVLIQFTLPGGYPQQTPTVLRCEADYLEKCEKDGYLSHAKCFDRAFEGCVK